MTNNIMREKILARIEAIKFDIVCLNRGIYGPSKEGRKAAETLQKAVREYKAMMYAIPENDELYKEKA